MILWPDREADGANESTTPSKMGTRDETGRLEKLIKKYDRGDLPKSDWLDTLVFRKMGEIHKVRHLHWKTDPSVLTIAPGRDSEIGESVFVH